MKYVMLYAERPDKHYYCIFPDVIVHADMAKALAATIPFPTIPVSGGEIDFDGIGNPLCGGFSDSLKLRSRPQDSAIIGTYSYTHGLMADPTPAPLEG